MTGDNAAVPEKSVWNTLHRRFCERRAEWDDAIGKSNLVIWGLPVGDRPYVAEGLARFDLMRDKGASDAAFGWAWLQHAKLWQERSCKGHATE